MKWNENEMHVNARHFEKYEMVCAVWNGMWMQGILNYECEWNNVRRPKYMSIVMDMKEMRMHSMMIYVRDIYNEMKCKWIKCMKIVMEMKWVWMLGTVDYDKWMRNQWECRMRKDISVLHCDTRCCIENINWT